MVRHVDVLQAGQVVMAMCHIAVVQPQVTEISKKLVKVIVPPMSCVDYKGYSGEVCYVISCVVCGQ